MNAKPVLARPHILTTIAGAALAAVIAIGLLSAVAGLFQRDGAPFEQVVVAEHACAESCVRLRARGVRAIVPRRIPRPERREPLTPR